MKERIPFTVIELGYLVYILNKLNACELNDEEKNILNLIETEKKETQKTLGRSLTEEEQVVIEMRIPGGWGLVGKLQDIAAQAVKVVKSRRIK